MSFIEKALSELLEKAIQRGSTKKNNPKYRMSLNKKGHRIWVLVNQEELVANHKEGVDLEHPKHLLPELSDKVFNVKRSEGKAEIHYDEAPTVEKPEDLEFLDFISDDKKKTILSNLEKIKFYGQSIKLANALKKIDVANAHSGMLDFYKNKNKEIVERSFAGKNVENVLDEQTVRELNSKPNVQVLGFNDNSLNYLNTYYKGLDLVSFVQDCEKTILETKDKLTKKLDLDEIPDFNPNIKIQLNSSGFNISISKPSENFLTDSFGFKHDIGINISRNFSKNGDKASVYHSYFQCQDGLKGLFAKNIMKTFYKQYRNVDLDEVSVSANLGSQEPINGENTWGKWGFTIDKGKFGSRLLGMQEKVGKKLSVEDSYIKHQERDKIIINHKGVDGKIIEEIIDQTTPSINPVTGIENSYQITTKSNTQGEFKSRVKRSIKITQEHVDTVRAVFEDWKQNNPSEQRFRLKELYEKVNKDVVIALMRGGSWDGECLLSKPSQRADFEDNLFKVYPQ